MPGFSVKLIQSKGISKQQEKTIIKILQDNFTQSKQQWRVALSIQKQLRQKINKSINQKPSIIIKRDDSQRLKPAQQNHQQWDIIAKIDINYTPQRQKSASRNASRSSTPYKSLGKSPNKSIGNNNLNQNPIIAYIICIRLQTNQSETQSMRQSSFVIEHQKCSLNKINEGRYVNAPNQGQVNN